MFFHPDLETQLYWQHVNDNRCHWCAKWIPKPHRTCGQATGTVCLGERQPDASLLSIIYQEDDE